MTVLRGFVAACLLPAAAAGEPVDLVRGNGPDENRVNIVVLGDGYTQGEIDKYADDVEVLLTRLFAEQPFADYAAYFNVRRIDVVSRESGADYPLQQIFRDTALHAQYECLGEKRPPWVLCVNDGAVEGVLDRSVPSIDQPIVLVLVNDQEYGGSARGTYAVASVHHDSAAIMLHELGHSLGDLADEYLLTDRTRCQNWVEPDEVNATRESTVAAIKWSHWIEPSTPVPATDATPGIVSAFEGARYCETGLYRPTYKSKMRNVRRPFEQVNTEQLIRRIYNFVKPIDTTSPPAGQLRSDRCEPLTFRVESPTAPTLMITWTIDGRPAGSQRSLMVQTCPLEAGWHTIEVMVHDVTAAVRARDGRYEARSMWQLEVVK